MSVLRDILDKIVNSKKLEVFYKKSNTVEGKSQFVKNAYIYNNQIKKLSDKLMNTVDDQLVLEAIINIIPEQLFDFQMVKDIQYYTNRNLFTNNVDGKIINEFDRKCKEALETYNKSKKDRDDLKILLYDGFIGFNDKEDKLLAQSLKSVFPRFLAICFENEDIDRIKIQLEENINKEFIDDELFTEDDLSKLPNEVGDLDTHPLENEILKLKESDDFKDDIKALETLDKVNNIIVQANIEQKDYQSELAEAVGIGIETERANSTKAMMDEEEQNLYDNRKDSYTLILKDSSTQNKLQALKKFNIEFPETSLEVQNKIIEMGNFMDEKGITTGLPFQSETGFKEYSFQNMLKEREKVIEAIKNKDKNKILVSANKMIELEKAHNKIVKELGNINDSNSISSNISSSRNENIPFKYRQDFIGVSRANALFMAKTYANQYHLNFNDLVKNPVKTFVDGADQFKRNNKASQYFLEHSNDKKHLLKMMFRPSAEFTTLVGQDNEYFRGSFRLLETFPSLEVDRDNAKKIEYAINGVYLYWVSPENDTIDKVKYGLVDDPVNMVANFVSAKGDDFSPYVFTPSVSETIDFYKKEMRKPFDRVNSIKKSNSKDVIEGMLDIRDYDSSQVSNDTVKEGLKLAAKDVLNSKIELTKNDNHIIKYFKKKKEIPQQFIDNFNNEKLLANVKANGVSSKDELASLIHNIATNQKKYQETSTWNKIFHREYRDQRDIANKLMDELISKTNDRNSIIEAINLVKEGQDNEPRFNELLDSINNNLNPIIIDNGLHENLSNVFDERQEDLNNSKVVDNDDLINQNQLVNEDEEIHLN